LSNSNPFKSFWYCPWKRIHRYASLIAFSNVKILGFIDILYVCMYVCRFSVTCRAQKWKLMYDIGYLHTGFGMSFGSLKYPDTSMNIPWQWHEENTQLVDLFITSKINRRIHIYRNLNSSPNDNAHEEIRDNAGYGHHQAFNYGDTRIKAQHEENIMFKSWMKADHEITNSSRNKSNHYQERHCRNGVANHKCDHTIVPI